MPLDTARDKSRVGGDDEPSSCQDSAADVVGVTVREEKMLKIARFAPELAERIEHDVGFAGPACINKDEVTRGVEQRGIGAAISTRLGALDDFRECHEPSGRR